jgi:hypothetical protein
MVRELKRLEGLIGVIILILVLASPFFIKWGKELFMFIGGSITIMLILFFQARISMKQIELLALERAPNFLPQLHEKDKPETDNGEPKTVIGLTNYSRDPIRVRARVENCPEIKEEEREEEVTILPSKYATVKFFCKPEKVELKSYNLFEPSLTVELVFYPGTGEIERK